MTVFENLLLYIRLKGIKTDLQIKTCFSLINLFDLNGQKNKLCSALSGGNKRKLSVAIAFIGNFRISIKISSFLNILNLGSPHLILLDEPTS